MSRNSWHSHPGGQILIATAGKGYYQEKGKPIQVLKPGDVIAIAPDVKHWHGAAPDNGFTHMAINTKVSLGATEWYDPVTDEEYNVIKNNKMMSDLNNVKIADLLAEWLHENKLDK